MDQFSTELFVGTLALVGGVIVLAALLSGLIERTGLPQVAVLLGLGAAIGPAGLNLLNVQLDSPILRIVATLSLTMVLFTDAVSLDLREVRRNLGLTLLMLGPGTLVLAATIALAAWLLLGLSPVAALILGAALASVDPIMLRGMLRSGGLSSRARLALRLEGGMNDVTLLPIVLIAIAFLEHGTPELAEWGALALDLFVLGPGAGVIVGLLSVAVLDLVRRRIGVRRDYESLYALGVAFTAFAAAEAVHGSGFLAAFAAGMTVSALDVELCDCFLEYGETTAEMMLLFTFVVLGSSLIWSGLALLSLPVLLFVVCAILARIPAIQLALLRTQLGMRDRLLIGWFGPRGLGSLLLVLLAVFAGFPGSEQLFALAALVVLASVVLHGFTPLLIARKHPELSPPAGATPAPAVPKRSALEIPLLPRDVPVNGGPQAAGAHVEVVPPQSAEQSEDTPRSRAEDDRITLDQLRELQQRGEPVMIVDVRTERALSRSELQPAAAVRIAPDVDAGQQAAALNLPHAAWLVALCA